MIENLVTELSHINAILKEETSGTPLSLDDGIAIIRFFDRYKKTKPLIDYILETAQTDAELIIEECEALQAETEVFLAVYRTNKDKFCEMDFCALCNQYKSGAIKSDTEEEVDDHLIDVLANFKIGALVMLVGVVNQIACETLDSVET